MFVSFSGWKILTICVCVFVCECGLQFIHSSVRHSIKLYLEHFEQWFSDQGRADTCLLNTLVLNLFSQCLEARLPPLTQYSVFTDFLLFTCCSSGRCGVPSHCKVSLCFSDDLPCWIHTCWIILCLECRVSNSGHHTWQPMPLPAETSHHPGVFF